MNKEAQTSEVILEVRDLWIEYRMRKKKTPAVRGVDFSVKRGETYGLVGESGCGKSTVAYAVMGYLDPKASAPRGQVLLNGRDMLTAPPAEKRRAWGREVAMVYQDPMSSLNPSLTVKSQLNEVLTLGRGMSGQQATTESANLLAGVNIPDPEAVLTRYPHQLSGGMKQRVCIAMALAAQPRLLVMDEPTTALDVTTASQVLELLPPLQARYNLAVLYISHDLGVVARVCDRVGVMYAGRLVEEAPVRELYHQPRHPYTRGLFSCLPKFGASKAGTRLSSLPGQVIHQAEVTGACAFKPRCRFADGPGCAESLAGQEERAASGQSPLVEIAPGHRVACDSSSWPVPEALAPERPTAASAGPAGKPGPILSVSGLQTEYKVSSGLWGGRLALKAVDGVSFSLERGQTLAVVGESGCGKSSLARTLVGLNPITGGEATLEGQSLTGSLADRPKALSSLMAMVFQNPDSTLNPKHSIGYTLARPLGLNYGLAGAELAAETTRYLGLVGLGPDYAGRYPRELSGGEKQRVAIARALASRPDLVVCDEPTSALDVSVQAAIINLLLDLQARLNISYVFISHDLSVVRYLSDQVAIMYLGRFCETGPSEEVFAKPAHYYTRALLSSVSPPDPDAPRNPIKLEGSPPSLARPPLGCRFNTRCPLSKGALCENEAPPAVSLSGYHQVFCHLYR